MLKSGTAGIEKMRNQIILAMLTLTLSLFSCGVNDNRNKTDVTTDTNTDTGTGTDTGTQTDTNSDTPEKCNEDNSAVMEGTHPHVNFKWKFETGLWKINYPPIVMGNQVFAVSENNTLYALDRTTGSLNWSFQVPGTITKEPDFPKSLIVNPTDGILYIAGPVYKYYALNAADGSIRWEKSLTTGLQYKVRMPLLKDGTLYIPEAYSWILRDRKAVLHAVDAVTGVTKWTYTSDNYWLGTPSIEGAKLYLAGIWDGPPNEDNEGHKLWAYGLDLASCQVGNCIVDWTFHSGDGRVKTLYSNGGITSYLGYEDYVVGIRQTDGVEAWRFYTGNWSHEFAGAGDEIYVGSANNRVYRIDNQTGVKVWEYRTGCKPMNYNTQSPVVVGDVVYAFLLGTHNIIAIDRATGAFLWNAPLGIESGGKPNFDGNMIFMGDVNGTVWAYDFK